MSSIPPRVGDRIIAAGTSLGPDRLEVELYYANLQNLVGQVRTVDSPQQAPFRLVMNDRYDVPHNTPYVATGHDVLIDPRALLGNGQAGDVELSLRPAQVVQIVGRELDGIVLAVNILL